MKAASPRRAPQRPKGIFKSQAKARVHPNCDDDHKSTTSTSSTASKSNLKRLYSDSDTGSDDEDTKETVYIYLVDYGCSPGNHRDTMRLQDDYETREMPPRKRPRKGPVVTKTTKEFTLEDWEELRHLFGNAASQYANGAAPSEMMPLLRAVLQECQRFMTVHPDPSVVFSEMPIIDTRQRYPLQHAALGRQKCQWRELPTAFHTVLGTTLFYFGHLLSQDASLALPNEPSSPLTYWLAALDVFETGDNLPCRTSGYNPYDGPEDWRMAIAWGRTLLALAEQTITLHDDSLSPASASSSSSSQPIAFFAEDEPTCTPDSIFKLIAKRRAPRTQRMTLSTATPHDLLNLATDQFSRGIFHMPHPQNYSSIFEPRTLQPFSRAKELYTIASEVLLLAECLEVSSQRQNWAAWADSVFGQMKMESDMDNWRTAINCSRGRCWLIAGSSGIETLEDAIEGGDVAALDSEDAQDAREALGKAIDFLERVVASPSSDLDARTETEEVKQLLAEAMVSLANLTLDSGSQEALYAKAQTLCPVLDTLMDKSS